MRGDLTSSLNSARMNQAQALPLEPVVWGGRVPLRVYELWLPRALSYCDLFTKDTAVVAEPGSAVDSAV